MTFLKQYKKLSKAAQTLYALLFLYIISEFYQLGILFYNHYFTNIDFKYSSLNAISNLIGYQQSFSYLDYVYLFFLLISLFGIVKSVLKQKPHKLVTIYLIYFVPNSIFMFYHGDFLNIYYYLTDQDYIVNGIFSLLIVLIQIAIIIMAYLVYHSNFKQQEFPIEFQDAPLKKRILNRVLDVFMIFFVISSFNSPLAMLFYSSYHGIIPTFIEFLAYGAIYYFITEFIFRQTFGKCITNTIVVGEKLNVMVFLKRTLARLIPFEPYSFLFSKNKGWHDTLSKTKVADIKHNTNEERYN